MTPTYELAGRKVEISDEQIESLVADMVAEHGGEEAKWLLLKDVAQEYSPRGFFAFYELIYRRLCPEHTREWIYAFFDEDPDQPPDLLIESFRGSTKTTVVTNCLAAFLIGKFPTGCSLLIQVNDQIARDNSLLVADIIENNPGWKLVHPNLVPDKKVAWGAQGYEIKDESMDYSEWRQRCTADKGKDNTFLGAGYSTGIIGKHPTVALFIDDIHDEKNTQSERELANVIRVLTGTIIPMMSKSKAKKLIIGTPWVEGDALDYLKKTGEFRYMSTPLYDEDGKCVWEEEFDEKTVSRLRNTVGEREFARMYLLDLAIANVDGVRYFQYPSSEIDMQRWRSGGGCDYASIMEEKNREKSKRSKFSLVFGFIEPKFNRLIIADGIHEHATQLEAEQHLKKPQVLFKGWTHTMFEADGKGEEAYMLFSRNPGLKIVPFKVERIKKNRRFEITVIPWLENGTILISDADTPFLNACRKSLDQFPHGNNDIRDALYGLCRCFPEILVVPDTEEQMKPVEDRYKEDNLNPYTSISRSSR